MRIAVIGSRGLKIKNLGDYIPDDVTEIVSGGAKGVDTSAREFAVAHGLKLTEFLPEYGRYRRAAPLKRNVEIINHSDMVIAFWDGVSKGTKYVVDYCKKHGVPVEVYIITDSSTSL